MYEDGEIAFVEVPEEEYNLFDTTLACAACHWVAYEVYKVREKDIKQYGTFPGAAFFLSNLKTTTGGIFVNIHPVLRQGCVLIVNIPILRKLHCLLKTQSSLF